MKTKLYSLFLSVFLVLLGLNSSAQTEPLSIEEKKILETEEATEVIESPEFDTIVIVETYSSDTAPYFSDQIIRERLQSIEKTIPLTFNPVTRGFIDYFTTRNRAYTKLMLQRKDYYFPLFESLLEKHGMPTELKYLAVVESGLHPRAVSRVGAAGLWQFMPYTGKSFNLNQDFYIDERLDIYKSTEAACLYLKQLYQMFGDWELAIASYNCGPGNVRKAIRKSGGKRNFWQAYRFLPKETRSYVPQFVALAYALNYPEEHFIFPEGYDLHVDYDTLHFDNTISFNALAFITGLCLEDLVRLNPAVKHGIVPALSQYKVVIPGSVSHLVHENFYCLFDTLNCYAPAELQALPSHLAWRGTNTTLSTTSGQRHVHKVRPGEALSTIAARYRVTVTQLKSWNQLKGSTIYVGQKLIIWRSAGASISPTPPQQAKINMPLKTTPQSSKGLFHEVKPGDTLWSIAAQYEGVTIEKLKQLNQLQGNTIKSGTKLRIG